MKITFTREEVLALIEEAFWDGIEQGGVDYAGEYFLAEDYLKSADKEQSKR